MIGKRKLVIGAFVCVTLFMAACGQQAADNSAKPPEASNKPEREPEKVVLYYPSGEPDQRYFELVKKKFPEYDISFIPKGRKLEDVIATGERFDIYQDALGVYEQMAVNYGFLYDMTDLVKAHHVDVNRFEPGIMDAIRGAMKGQLYALPLTSNNFVLYYNKTIFDKFGVSYPKDGMNWDEALALAQKMTRTEAGQQYYGLTNSPSHMIRINQMSIPLADYDKNVPTINIDERWRRLFDMVFVQPTKDAGYQAGIAAQKKIPELNSFTKEQTVGMYLYLASLFATPEYLSNMDWNMVSVPTFKELPNTGTPHYPGLLGITKMARNKDAAMEVLKYMVSDELQSKISRIGIITPLKSAEVQKALGEETVFKGKNFGAAYYTKFAPIPRKGVYDADLSSIYSKYANQLIKNEVDMNTALRLAEEEASKKIAEYKNR
ncbi:MAG: extracellular solute-binding protein family 1 [Paenibacillus sp.]|nr:extracellular solute-binding protein family 1 [Paenibacillus sp.]